jgi:hypothetical protein
MKKALSVIAVLSFIGLCQTALSQTVEMAAKCDNLEKQLADLVKKPEGVDVQKIKEALGIDVLNSCATAEGKVICYQCLDKENRLRALQLLQKSEGGKFGVLGFGCKCNDSK